MDCVAEGVTTVRPIVSGVRVKRCHTHTRAARKRAQRNARGRTLVTRYRITPEQYAALYAAQSGLCAICRRATGKARALAVEHEHGRCDDHAPEEACPRCIRGLACKRCNRLIAFLGVAELSNAIRFLVDPPARKVLDP